MTEKLSLALLHNKPVVRMQYLDALIESKSSTNLIPEILPFIPEMVASDLEGVVPNEQIANVSLRQNSKRQNFFSGKAFVFFTKAQV